MKYLFKDRYPLILPMGISLIMGISSCQDDEDIILGDPSTIYFDKSYDISKEGDGVVKVFIHLDQAQNIETAVHFKVSGNASASSENMQNDYELLTDSPLIIKKGETRAAIEIKLTEDQIFEQELENIIFSIDGILEGNAELSPNTEQLIHVHEIEENDYLLFLDWESDRVVDLNMFIELPNKSLISAINKSDFEEVVMTNVKDQEHYFLDIWYQSGESSVAYQLSGLFAGEKEKKNLVSGSFYSENGGKSNGSQLDNSFQNFTMVKDGRALKVLK